MRTIIVTGNTSLMRVAAEEMGDATQWIRIAQANGILDPIIRGKLQIKIPAAPVAPTRGVIEQ